MTALASRLTGFAAMMLVSAVILGGCDAVRREVLWQAVLESVAVPCDAERSNAEPSEPGVQWVRIDGEYAYGFGETDVGCVLWQGEKVETNVRDSTGDVGFSRNCETPPDVDVGATPGDDEFGSPSIDTDFDWNACRLVLSRANHAVLALPTPDPELLQIEEYFDEMRPCDVQSSRTSPEDADLFYVHLNGMYFSGFEEEHRGCVIWQGIFVERPQLNQASEVVGTYHTCRGPGPGGHGGWKTLSGRVVYGHGTTYDAGRCAVVLSEFLVRDP